MIRLVGALLFLAAPRVIDAAHAKQPSFDCAKATLRVEKIICQDAGLAAIEAQMSELYVDIARATSVPDREAILRDQGDWLKGKVIPCGGDIPRRTGTKPDGKPYVMSEARPRRDSEVRSCLLQVFQERIDQLGERPIEPYPVPAGATLVKWQVPPTSLDGELRPLLSADEDHILEVFFIDLDGDGRDEFMVRVRPAVFARDVNQCFYVGCEFAIVKRRADKLRLLDLPVRLTRGKEPWVVLQSRTNGYREILLRDRETRHTANTQGIYTWQ